MAWDGLCGIETGRSWIQVDNSVSLPLFFWTLGLNLFEMSIHLYCKRFKILFMLWQEDYGLIIEYVLTNSCISYRKEREVFILDSTVCKILLTSAISFRGQGLQSVEWCDIFPTNMDSFLVVWFVLLWYYNNLDISIYIIYSLASLRVAVVEWCDTHNCKHAQLSSVWFVLILTLLLLCVCRYNYGFIWFSSTHSFVFHFVSLHLFWCVGLLANIPYLFYFQSRRHLHRKTIIYRCFTH